MVKNLPMPKRHQVVRQARGGFTVEYINNDIRMEGSTIDIDYDRIILMTGTNNLAATRNRREDRPESHGATGSTWRR